MWIDVTVPLATGILVWPGDAPFELRRDFTLAHDGANVSSLSFSAHTGTHIDAPAHYLEDAPTISDFPPAVGVGPARVLHIPDALEIRRDHLEPFHIQSGERILLKTANSLHPTRYRHALDASVTLVPDAAAYLAECRIALLGIDYLSVGDADAHRVLLSAGVWLVEGLLLEHVAAGVHELICLPLPLIGADGAPARVLLRQTNSSVA